MNLTKGPEVSAEEDVTVETLGPYCFIQSGRGQRLTQDTVLLAEFILPLKADDRVIDIGTSTGGVPLILAWKSAARKITGVEVMPGIARVAERNVEINGLRGRVEVVEKDFRVLKDAYPEGAFTVVASNPPYRKANSSRISPDLERAAARSDILGSLDELLNTASYLLAPEGRACFVFTTERFFEMNDGLRKWGLMPTRLRFVHTKEGHPTRLFLVEARRRGNLIVEDPVYL